MFLRFAAKGSAVWLGLLTAVLPASAGGARIVALKSARPAQVVKVTAGSNAHPVRIAVQKRPGTPGAKPASVPKAKPIRANTFATWRTAAARLATSAKARGGPKAHQGGPDDFQIDADTANQIEPQFCPGDNSYLYVLSSNQFGLDLYPAAKTNDPAFLKGNDYHLYFSRALSDRTLFPVGVFTEPGEQFEPTLIQPDVKDLSKYKMAWSAFLPDAKTEYKPDVPVYQDNGADVTYTNTATPVRVIQYSDDAFAAGGTQVTKTLAPASFWFIKTPGDPAANPPIADGYAPALVPDASPAWFPGDTGRNFIIFVTLRGYDKDKPDTHYTSLWVWDTSQEQSPPGTFSSGNPRQFLSIPGKSILQPKFRMDGTLAFTVVDTAFEPIAAGQPGAGTLPDPVFDIDVTMKALKDPSNQFFVKDATVYACQVRAGTWPSPGTPVQVTTFADKDGVSPRDMFPFWSPLGQLGFSSDRVDADNDGIADAVQVDPSKALFDIYAFQFAYNPNLVEDVAVPDQNPRRVTLGPQAPADDSNELFGAWVPLNVYTTSFGAIQPSVIYQSDNSSDGNWDIWWTDKTNFPINGNILIGLPLITGDPDLTADEKADLKQTRRVALPGDYVTISVQVNPVLLGPNTQVQAIIKDPDLREDAYFFSLVNANIVVPVWQEYGMWPVQLYAKDLAAYGTKYAATDDKPQFGAIVNLRPDTVRGGSWYTAKWFTPLEVSDFIIDVAVDGRASDNIGGFSTSPFVPTSRTLLVSDFAAGQRQIYATADTQTTAGIATESFFTYRENPNDVKGWGSVVCDTGATRWSPMGPRVEWQVAPVATFNAATRRYDLDFSKAKLNTNNPSVVGLFSWRSNEYDLWRTQCREPITLDELRQYLPYSHTQPGLPTTPTVGRSQRVADRCVIWMAPHASQLNGNAGVNSAPGNGGINNLGIGTIANIQTQFTLLKFLDPSQRTAAEKIIYGIEYGRMMVSGDDVGYALTQDGTITNPLLTQFRVAYESHYADSINGFETHRDELHGNATGTGGAGVYGLHPLPDPMELTPYWCFVPGSAGAAYYNPRHPAPTEGTWDDGAQNQMFIDSITGINVGVAGGSQLIYNYGPSSGGSTGNTDVAGVRSWQPLGSLENTSQRKTLYYAFGLEGIHRHYYLVNETIHTENRPARVFHNALDWLTTGAFTGTVFLTNNVTTLPDVLVWAVDQSNPEAVGRIQGTARTGADGSYYMDGMETGSYRLYAYKTGYSFQNPVLDLIDIAGAAVSSDNLLLSPVEPGTLSGFVRDKVSKAGLTGIVVKIHDIQNTVNLQTTTRDIPNPSDPTKTLSGWYEFNSIPAGLYVITIDDQTIGTVNYGSFTNDGNPLQVSTDLFITPGDTRGDTSFDISLDVRIVPPSPGTLVVNVTDVSSGTSAPAIGAVITVLDPITKAPVTTLDGGINPYPSPDGTSRFHIKAGQYDVTVAYTNTIKTYKTQTKTILVVPDDPATPDVVTTLSFEFGGILHTFTAGSVLMASLPYDYSGTPTAPITFSQVLTLTNAQLANALVGFDALTQGFLFYPNYPADTARLGRGYGFKLPADGKVLEQGTPMSGSMGIIRSEIGWNLIGDPWPGTVVWNGTGTDAVRVSKRDDATQTKMTIDDAKAAGLILSDLWGGSSVDANGNSVYGGTYQVASPTMSLVPYRAYWVKVAQPLLFYVPKPAIPTGLKAKAVAELEAMKGALMPTADTWGLNITASGDGMTDNGLALGISRRATAGIDPGLDLAKPLPMGGANYLYTAFPMGRAGIFATDIRGLATSNTWTFNVSTTLNARPVSITWTPIGNLPAGYSAWLVDTATGQRTNMSAVSQYAFRSARDGGVRIFRVEVRRAGVTR